MNSVVTRETVQDTLYTLGIKDPKAINQAIRTIDFYAVAMARRYAIPATAPPKLTPGQSDLEAGITCCMKCEKIKAWKMFPYDPKSDTGYSDVCKGCSTMQQVPRDPYLEITCSSCEERKNADTEFRRSNSKSGYRSMCRNCENGRRKCKECSKIRYPGNYIGGSKTCVFCLATKYLEARDRRKKVRV
jgi:hypothetical protein